MTGPGRVASTGTGAGRHGTGEVTVPHYLSGTSQWNKREHRLFSFISVNLRGKPLTSDETVATSPARLLPRPA